MSISPRPMPTDWRSSVILNMGMVNASWILFEQPVDIYSCSMEVPNVRTDADLRVINLRKDGVVVADLLNDAAGMRFDPDLDRSSCNCVFESVQASNDVRQRSVATGMRTTPDNAINTESHGETDTPPDALHLLLQMRGVAPAESFAVDADWFKAVREAGLADLFAVGVCRGPGHPTV